MNKDYRDCPGFDGACALIAAICSADSDKIAEYDEVHDQWYDLLWNAKGNYVCEFTHDVKEESIVGLSAQGALDKFGIKPFVPVEDMRKMDYTE